MKVKQNLQIVGACNITSNNMSISILSARLDTVLQNLHAFTLATPQWVQYRKIHKFFQEHLSSQEFLQTNILNTLITYKTCKFSSLLNKPFASSFSIWLFWSCLQRKKTTKNHSAQNAKIIFWHNFLHLWYNSSILSSVACCVTYLWQWSKNLWIITDLSIIKNKGSPQDNIWH